MIQLCHPSTFHGRHQEAAIGAVTFLLALSFREEERGIQIFPGILVGQCHPLGPGGLMSVPLSRPWVPASPATAVSTRLGGLSARFLQFSVCVRVPHPRLRCFCGPCLAGAFLLCFPCLTEWLFFQALAAWHLLGKAGGQLGWGLVSSCCPPKPVPEPSRVRALHCSQESLAM